MKYKDTVIVLLLMCLTWISEINGKEQAPDPPIWEYKYQYELFLKIYSQTQAIQRQLNRPTVKETQCPESWTKILDSCYFIPLHWKKTWLDAAEVCERLGGYLAILNTEEEDLEVSAFMRNVSTNDLHADSTYIWIGGFDSIQEGDWRWVNGEKMNYSNWRIALENVPLKSRHREDCLDWSDGWNDNNCRNKFHFLCERTPMCHCGCTDSPVTV